MRKFKMKTLAISTLFLMSLSPAAHAGCFVGVCGGPTIVKTPNIPAPKIPKAPNLPTAGQDADFLTGGEVGRQRDKTRAEEQRKVSQLLQEFSLMLKH
jgi:hypothetical protein